MAVNAILTGAASGLIGGLFGGGKPKMSWAEKMYRQAITEAMKTNLVDLDKQQVASQREQSQKDAMGTLSAYDAQAASQGSGTDQFDSRKEIARSNIAYKAAKDTATLESDLAASRPFRKLQLATGNGALGDAGKLALSSQVYRDQKQANDFGSVFELAQELLKGVGKKKSSAGAGQDIPYQFGGP